MAFDIGHSCIIKTVLISWTLLIPFLYYFFQIFFWFSFWAYFWIPFISSISFFVEMENLVFIRSFPYTLWDILVHVVMILLKVLDTNGNISGIGVTAFLTLIPAFLFLVVFTYTTNFAPFCYFGGIVPKFTILSLFLYFFLILLSLLLFSNELL